MKKLIKIIIAFSILVNITFGASAQLITDKHRIEEFIHGGFYSNVYPYHREGVYKYIYNNFGKPNKISVKIKNDWKEPEKYYVYIWEYEKLKFVTYELIKWGEKKRELVDNKIPDINTKGVIFQEIWLEDDKYTLGYGIKIGMNKEEIKHTLGAPKKETKNLLVYEGGEAHFRSATVDMTLNDKGNVIKFYWNYKDH